MFGVTLAGVEDPFNSNLLSSLGVTLFTDEEFHTAFENTSKANNGIVTKKDCLPIICQTYGFEPLPEEVLLFVDTFQIRIDENIYPMSNKLFYQNHKVEEPHSNNDPLSWEVFHKGLLKIREGLDRMKQSSIEYTSGLALRADKRRHVRKTIGSNDFLKTPMTAMQCYGWHQEEVLHVPKNGKKCEETKYAEAVFSSNW